VSNAAIFDMDGVLIDSGAHHRHAWRMLLDELGAEPADPGLALPFVAMQKGPFAVPREAFSQDVWDRLLG